MEHNIKPPTEAVIVVEMSLTEAKNLKQFLYADHVDNHVDVRDFYGHLSNAILEAS